MTADELQHLASYLRWGGGAITVLGIALTFGSNFVADKLVRVQRADKLHAQEQLKETKAELEQTKVKTAELELRLAPRTLTAERREQFIKYLKTFPKGPVALEHSGQTIETIKFTEEIRSLLEAAGFTISHYEMPLGYIIKEAPAPWFMSIVVGAGEHPSYAEQLMLAFREIGIEAIGTDGKDIAKPGQVKVYVGAK